MGVRMRLPHVVYFGLGYKVRVILAAKTLLREVLEDETEDVDAVWDHTPEKGYCGTIYIWNKLSAERRRECYWHEMKHALTDIHGWDSTHALAL